MKEREKYPCFGTGNRNVKAQGKIGKEDARLEAEIEIERLKTVECHAMLNLRWKRHEAGAEKVMKGKLSKRPPRQANCRFCMEMLMLLLRD